jgi:uncharacterized protein YbbK (DUF523 family)/uncharacterized protein YbgA (DUF1722 family)
MRKPKVAVSACLLGKKVRHDGGDKHDNYIIDILSKFVELVPFCPEVEMGLGVPREPIRFVLENNEKKLVGTKSEVDFTSLGKRIAKEIAISLYDVDGIILMKKSPSCGLEKVKVYHKGVPQSSGMGIFAQAFIETYPTIPHIDSGRLMNNSLKEHFIRKVFSYFIFKTSVDSVKDLQKFHKEHKYIIMEHQPSKVSVLGKIAADSKGTPFRKTKAAYHEEFFNTLNISATKSKKCNVFFHLLGYLKNYLNAKEKQNFIKLVDDYKAGKTNYVSVWTILKHFIEKYDVAYLKDHVYFNPISYELGLLQYKE